MTALEARLLADLEAERAELRKRLGRLRERIKGIKRRERQRNAYAAKKDRS